jgi:hypothetical protein
MLVVEMTDAAPVGAVTIHVKDAAVMLVKPKVHVTMGTHMTSWSAIPLMAAAVAAAVYLGESHGWVAA